MTTTRLTLLLDSHDTERERLVKANADTVNARNRLADIYREHFEEIRRFIAKRFPGSDAADLAQEVFLRALCVDEGYQIQQPRGFLFRIASNLALDHVRLRGNRAFHMNIDDVSDHLGTDDANPEKIVCAQQRLAILQSAIDELPPRCRTVFTLHKFGHRSHGEIAEELGISVNMVEKHIIKALAHCRRRLSEMSGCQ